MSNFRRMRKGDNNPVHFSPTDLAKCPIILEKKKLGKGDFVYTPKVRTIFEKGTHIHVLEGLWRENARNFVEKELHMTMIAKDKSIIFSGYADFIMLDQNGLYIEDLKTCDRKAFYHFGKDGGSWSEILQVSAYRLLYFVIFGVKIDRAVITKIDRDNPLNRYSLEVDMLEMEDMEDFILNHPTVLKITKNMINDDFEKATLNNIKSNRWVCKYCQDNKDCFINNKLTKEEKLAKKKKVKQKATFNKLVK